MRASRLGGFLLGVGAAVGVLAVIGLATGFEPSRLPPALLDIAAYKLTFLAAAGLLVAGAVILRRSRRSEGGSDNPISGAVHRERTIDALPASPLGDDPLRHAKPASKVDVSRRS